MRGKAISNRDDLLNSGKTTAQPIINGSAQLFRARQLVHFRSTVRLSSVLSWPQFRSGRAPCVALRLLRDPAHARPPLLQNPLRSFTLLVWARVRTRLFPGGFPAA